MKTAHPSHKKSISSTQVMVLGFLCIILIGTLLLSLPISSADGTPTNPLDAAFTAVSASCVTGLTTLDTATHWNLFGHIVILLLIQIGGLGFMTMGILLSLLIRRQVTPKERMLVAMSYNVSSYGSTMQLVRRIVIGTLTIEGIGALLLSIRLIPDFGVAQGIFKSVFHSISAFCNAGFDIMGVGNPSISAMSHYATDPLVILTLSLLIICGALGFLVWSDLISLVREGKRHRLSVYSRFVLLITAILLVLGTLFFAIFEWNQPNTLGAFSSPFEKILASFFQSVTWRTAGFATMHNGAFTQNSQLLGMLLMFIGGASGSTAGGVKVATFGILVYTVFCVAIGKRRTVLGGRRISDHTFVRAAATICLQLTMIFVGTMLVNSFVSFDLLSVLYEVVSALSTVGVTTGITPLLGVVPKLTVMCLMFFGRVGILTITYALMNHRDTDHSPIRYPDANMPVG